MIAFFFFFLIIQVQIVKKNSNLHNFFIKHPPPLPLPPLKRKIYPPLQPIPPKRKKLLFIFYKQQQQPENHHYYYHYHHCYLTRQFLFCKENVCNQLLLYQYYFTKGLLRAVFGKEKTDTKLDIFKGTIKDKKWAKLNKISIFFFLLLFISLVLN